MGIEIRAHLVDKPFMDYEITLVELEKLIPHEMTIDEELQKFKEDVVRDGSVFHPMLIDKESYLILDGHHRHAGLLELGYTNGPAILIDYNDDNLVKLGTWHPLINNKPSEVVPVLEKAGLMVEEGFSEVNDLKLLENRVITAIVCNLGESYHVKGEREKIFQLVRELWLDDIKYYDYRKHCLRDARDDKTSIIAWSYTKKEILENVKQGIIHFPKTTRHELAYRYKKCYYPLTRLNKKS